MTGKVCLSFPSYSPSRHILKLRTPSLLPASFRVGWLGVVVGNQLPSNACSAGGVVVCRENVPRSSFYRGRGGEGGRLQKYYKRGGRKLLGCSPTRNSPG